MKAAELRAFVTTEDQKIIQKIEESNKFKSIHTKNMLDLKYGDFSSSDFSVFIFFDEERDYTQENHN